LTPAALQQPNNEYITAAFSAASWLHRTTANVNTSDSIFRKIIIYPQPGHPGVLVPA
jgi:hypothetical protein